MWHIRLVIKLIRNSGTKLKSHLLLSTDCKCPKKLNQRAQNIQFESGNFHVMKMDPSIKLCLLPTNPWSVLPMSAAWKQIGFTLITISSTCDSTLREQIKNRRKNDGYVYSYSSHHERWNVLYTNNNCFVTRCVYLDFLHIKSHNTQESGQESKAYYCRSIVSL